MSTDTDLIRNASSKWLRDNEARARTLLSFSAPEGEAIYLQKSFGWTEWQVLNMLTYLSLVSEGE